MWIRFKESSDPSKKDFSPPTLIEKFQQPIIKSEPFTFEVSSMLTILDATATLAP